MAVPDLKLSLLSVVFVGMRPHRDARAFCPLLTVWVGGEAAEQQQSCRVFSFRKCVYVPGTYSVSYKWKFCFSLSCCCDGFSLFGPSVVCFSSSYEECGNRRCGGAVWIVRGRCRSTRVMPYMQMLRPARPVKQCLCRAGSLQDVKTAKTN